MSRSISIAVCLGTIVGFLACCFLGRWLSPRSGFRDFVRLHPFLEPESSYYPTASQLAATARAQCPPGSGKILVVLGGNSVFNGSGQKGPEVWSRILQSDLGDGFHVINCSAPGAGVMDTGGVVFQMLARDYPEMLFVTNTEPGYYAPADRSAYAFFYWDAYYKGLMPDRPGGRGPLTALALPGDDGSQELKLGYALNGVCYFNDLWTTVAYNYHSTVWTSWLKGRSFRARRALPDWYEGRPVIHPGEDAFAKMLPGHLDTLRRRKSVAPLRFRQQPDGHWTQSEESLRTEAEDIAALLPKPLEQRSLVVFTPINPWFLERLTSDEKQRLEISFRNGARLLEDAGFHALSTLDRGFEPTDFGDTIHLSPAGGQRLAHLVAAAVQELARERLTPQPR